MSLNNATLKKSLLELAPFYRNVIFFGFFTNFLVLAPSWYMLEVYDRVIYSRNITTLAMLTVMVVFLYLIMESLEWVRVKMMHQASLQVEQQLQSRVFDTAFQAKLKSAQFPVHQVFSDFKALKESLSSSAFMSLVDIPYVSIFLIAIFFIHPLLALLTLVGLVEAGLGIAAVPRLAMPPADHPLLVSVPLVEPAISRTIGLIRLRGRQLPPAAQQLHDMIRAMRRMPGSAKAATKR